MHWETMPLTDRILSNGIHLLAEPIAATKAVAIGFWFSRGSRDESEKCCGITHFVEHMLFKGTRSLSSFEIAQFFDRIGGYVNAFTERENLCVYCVVPSRDALEASLIISRMLFESVFSDNDINKERTVISSEILTSQDDPEEMGIDTALSLMYPHHGFSRPIAGRIEDIESLSGDKIREYYAHNFKNTAPVVTAAGNINIEQFEKQLEKIEGISCGTNIETDLLSPVWTAGRYYPYSPFSQSQIFLSYPLNDLKTESDWFSLSIINAIIGDTVSSRLFQNLREKRGLCYSTYSFFISGRDASFWTAYAATPPEKTLEAAESLLTEMRLLRVQPLSEMEIEDARSHLCGEMDLSADDMENRMKRLARQFFYIGTISALEESVQKLSAVTRNDIEKQLNAFFRESDESLIIYGGKKQIKECRKKWK